MERDKRVLSLEKLEIERSMADLTIKMRLHMGLVTNEHYTTLIAAETCDQSYYSEYSEKVLENFIRHTIRAIAPYEVNTVGFQIHSPHDYTAKELFNQAIITGKKHFTTTTPSVAIYTDGVSQPYYYVGGEARTIPEWTTTTSELKL